MASAKAKRRIVSNTLAVRRSGKTINLHKKPRYESVGPTFQPLLDCSECSFERRAGSINGDFSHDAAFQSCQTRLLRTLEGDQIEAGALGIFLIPDADGQVKSGLEVVARVKLLHGNGVGRVRGARTSIKYRLHDPKRGLESEIYLFPVELGLDVVRSCFRIIEQIAIEFRQINRKCLRAAEQGPKCLSHFCRMMFVPICSERCIPSLDVSLQCLERHFLSKP